MVKNATEDMQGSWKPTRSREIAAYPCIMACRSRSAAVCEFAPSWEAAMLAGRPSQLRDAGCALVGLQETAVGATVVVDSVGTALADLVEMCFGRGGGFL